MTAPSRNEEMVAYIYIYLPVEVDERFLLDAIDIKNSIGFSHIFSPCIADENPRIFNYFLARLTV